MGGNNESKDPEVGMCLDCLWCSAEVSMSRGRVKEQMRFGRSNGEFLQVL